MYKRSLYYLFLFLCGSLFVVFSCSPNKPENDDLAAATTPAEGNASGDQPAVEKTGNDQDPSDDQLSDDTNSTSGDQPAAEETGNDQDPSDDQLSDDTNSTSGDQPAAEETGNDQDPSDDQPVPRNSSWPQWVWRYFWGSNTPTSTSKT